MELLVRTGPQAGGRIVLDPGQTLTIGRHDSSDLRLEDPSVSRFHARLRVDHDGMVWLEDHGSANGTFVDGRRVSGSERLLGGERIQIGQSSLTVAPRGVEPAAPVPSPGYVLPSAPGPATIERRALRESVSRANQIAIAAVIIALVAVGAGGAVLLSSRPANGPDTAALVTDLRPSVVHVISDLGDGFSGVGTGWVYDAGDGLVVTNHHVVDGGQAITIAGEGMPQRAAEIVATAPCEDLALLRVARRDDLETLSLGSQSELRQGETVVALGYPVNAGPGTDLVVTTGIVSVVKTVWTDGFDTPDYPNVIQTDAAINPGNSGGPLVNAAGRLVGVNSAVRTTSGGRIIQGQGYAIGVDRVKEIIPILREGTSLAWTGMAFEYPARGSDLTDLGLPPIAGLIVRNVVPGTPADEAGFGAEPALVVEVDGVEMDATLPGYCDAVEVRRSGDESTFVAFFAGDAEPREIRVSYR